MVVMSFYSIMNLLIGLGLMGYAVLSFIGIIPISNKSFAMFQAIGFALIGFTFFSGFLQTMLYRYASSAGVWSFADVLGDISWFLRVGGLGTLVFACATKK